MSKPVFSLGFDVPFTEAIAWAKDRISVLPDTYYNDLPAQARSRAFTISGLSALDQIQGVLDSLHKATAEGQTFAQWKKGLSPEVLALGPARLDNIFRTAIQTHYNIGRYQQQEANKAHRPYRMWDAINDGRTRPAHKAMDNFIAPIDDPIWRKWSAPAGFRCRCSTLTLTEAQAVQRGYKVGNQPPIGSEPDKGWDYDKLTGQDAALKRITSEKLGRTTDRILREMAEKVLSKPPLDKRWDANGGLDDCLSLLFSFSGDQSSGCIKADSTQKTWEEHNLPSFRDLKKTHSVPAPVMLQAGKDTAEALNIMRGALGLQEGGNLRIQTPTKEIELADWTLFHIVEKRDDRRERYAHFILPTLQSPLEIWTTEYSDGKRERYIKLFQGKYDLLAIVRLNQDGSLLWNIMQRKTSGMDALRMGSSFWKSY